VKECEALAKYLSFVISFNPQSLRRMERPETDLEFAQYVFVHQLALLPDKTYSHETNVKPTAANSHASTDVTLLSEQPSSDISFGRLHVDQKV